MKNVTIFYGSRSEFEKIKPSSDFRSLTDMVMEIDTDSRSFIIELPDKPEYIEDSFKLNDDNPEFIEWLNKNQK